MCNRWQGGNVLRGARLRWCRTISPLDDAALAITARRRRWLGVSGTTILSRAVNLGSVIGSDCQTDTAAASCDLRGRWRTRLRDPLTRSGASPAVELGDAWLAHPLQG